MIHIIERILQQAQAAFSLQKHKIDYRLRKSAFDNNDRAESNIHL